MAHPLLSRRGFFGSAGAVCAAASAGVFAAPSRSGRLAPGSALHIGVASYSLRRFPLDQALAICQSLGVRHLTLKDVHLPRTDAVDVVAANRRTIEAAGIRVMGGGTITWNNPVEAEIRRDFEYARAAGMPLMVCAPRPDTLDIVERLVREFGIGVALHNHGPEDKVYPTPYEAFALIERRDPRMGLCVDIGHTARAGRDPVTAIRDLQARVLDVHVKDLKDLKVRGSDTECGRGVLDLPGVLGALAAFGFSGHVALEYEINENDPAPGMRESLAYLRGVAAAIRAA